MRRILSLLACAAVVAASLSACTRSSTEPEAPSVAAPARALLPAAPAPPTANSTAGSGSPDLPADSTSDNRGGGGMIGGGH